MSGPRETDSSVYTTLASYCAALETHGATVGDIPLLAKLREASDAISDLERRLAAACTVDVVDSSGRKIGDAMIDGCHVIGRITDEHAAAVLKASTGPRGVSVGYRVEVKEEPARPLSREDLRSLCVDQRGHLFGEPNTIGRRYCERGCGSWVES